MVYGSPNPQRKKFKSGFKKKNKQYQLKHQRKKGGVTEGIGKVK